MNMDIFVSITSCNGNAEEYLQLTPLHHMWTSPVYIKLNLILPKR